MPGAIHRGRCCLPGCPASPLESPPASTARTTRPVAVPAMHPRRSSCTAAARRAARPPFGWSRGGLTLVGCAVSSGHRVRVIQIVGAVRGGPGGWRGGTRVAGGAGTPRGFPRAARGRPGAGVSRGGGLVRVWETGGRLAGTITGGWLHLRRLRGLIET